MLSQTAIILITIYKKLISPLLMSRCCMYPSCSSYAITAFKEYGFIKGSALTIKRLIKCNPNTIPHCDPVPRKTV